MREYKFRAWDKDYKEMYKVNSVHWDEFGVIDDITIINGFDDILVAGPGRVKCVELMQYTGVVDEKGVEICEGDICKLSGESCFMDEYIFLEEDWKLTTKVKENRVGYVFQDINDYSVEISFASTFYEDIDIEIIGNIYENPELLEVQE